MGRTFAEIRPQPEHVPKTQKEKKVKTRFSKRPTPEDVHPPNSAKVLRPVNLAFIGHSSHLVRMQLTA